MNDLIAKRVWFITGCSRGLGRALALATLDRGHRVVATARAAESLAGLVDRYPDHCRTLALDVTRPEEVATVVAEAAAAFGRLDVVVNNAGYGLIGALEEVTEEQIRRNFETNFFGAVHVMRAALPILRTQRQGHFVTISAAAAIGNYPGFSIYGATKWALEGVSESLAAEVRPLGLKVTLVQPGPFRTDFIAHSLERAETPLADYADTRGKFQRLLESMDGRQPGDPAKAAAAIIAAVESERPPLRLVLGKYAIDKARRSRTPAGRELDAWAELGSATEFPPVS